MRIVIGSDHAGFPLKATIVDHIKSLGHEVHDTGSYDPNPVDFPDIAKAVTSSIVNGQADRGLMVCGTGVGASIAANKIKGIRAAVCHAGCRRQKRHAAEERVPQIWAHQPRCPGWLRARTDFDLKKETVAALLPNTPGWRPISPAPRSTFGLQVSVPLGDGAFVLVNPLCPGRFPRSDPPPT